MKSLIKAVKQAKNRVMTGNELYEEYCNEYPLIMGYREVSYESWLQRQVLELRENAVNKNCNIPRVMESDCDHEWLNHSFDHFGFLQEQICDKCGAKQSVP